ncbi:YdeI/OmpD-associated family protein [Hymenobacter sublimis]|uniref:YdeI/OmpD-associated family protein n=1 Tax=Hymenobacter sublimis TaxID=2933777 RepID=A0ABY4J693_9BACT|nr:YdeI/OmpD-associated family protein [Hymenobacter sublimis]UPL48351.1 YdeI/OmpD-associated family protein [Hymenobacter sublimis]
MNTREFAAELQLIGVNPFVDVPLEVLAFLFEQAGKAKGPIPVRGTVNQLPYQQTLVRFSGAWRLYINLSMLKNSPKRIGETIQVTIAFDPRERALPMHPQLAEALDKVREAQQVFNRLTPSRQQEIIRYITRLKTDESRARAVGRAIDFLLGKGRFIGRDTP